MPAIITTKQRIHSADLLKERFDELSTDKNYYLFIGKTTPWLAKDHVETLLKDDLVTPYDPDDEVDELPPFPCDSFDNFAKVWRDMLALKKILSVDVTFGIRRYNWETGTVFTAYSASDCQIFEHPTEEEILDVAGAYPLGPIYTITDEWKVYKCIDNAPTSLYPNGSPSTVKPTGTSTNIFQTADGYKWKYMYTVDQSDVLKFVTSDWIPVRTVDLDDIDEINRWPDQAAVQQAATANNIDALRVSEQGSGYTYIAEGAVVLGAAASNTIVLDDTGFNEYGSGSGGKLIIDSYKDSVLIVTNGSIVETHQITAYDPNVGGSEERTVTIDGVFANTIDNTYTFTIRPAIEISGDGTGAFAYAEVDTNPVGAFNVTEAIFITQGTGYTFASAEVVGGNGAGAIVLPEIGPIHGYRLLAGVPTLTGGHGSDAVQELGGHFLILNVQMAYNEGDTGSPAGPDFPLINEYRKIGILRDVREYGAPNNLATEITLRPTEYFTLSGVNDGPFETDEIITGATSGAKAKVVQYLVVDDTPVGDPIESATMIFTQDDETGYDDFVATEVLTGSISTATATLDAINAPEALPLSGELLYIEQRRPVVRAEDQVEDIKLIIEF